MKRMIILDSNNLQLEAELFDNKIADNFYKNLPYEIDLTQWGQEMYGLINIDLGEDDPVPEIPKGGLAYTNQGNYFCIFYGQTPAWSVEYIGRIIDDSWQKLLSNHYSKMKIYKKE